jgi:hypothetical protein
VYFHFCFGATDGAFAASTFGGALGAGGAEPEIHTRNEWRRCKITLETGGEDLKLHSFRVEKM